MKLSNLLENLEYEVVKGDIATDIVNIAYDSRKVQNGYLFVCIEGYKTDGHNYIDSACENGARAILVMHDVEVNADITIIKIKNTRLALAEIANTFYENPSKDFNLIGITGTKGKTTTTYMIKSILEADNRLVGLIGTISNKIGEKEITAERTTPESYDLQGLFNDMKDAAVDSVVMEISSHALELYRVSASDFDIGVFLNLTQDHLDFHSTFENYFEAKLKIFDLCKVGIINIDSDYGKLAYERAKKLNKKIYTLGISSEADFMAKNIKLNQGSVGYDVITPWENGRISVNIPGKFTIYNSLAAIAVCLCMNVTLEIVQKGISNIKVPGRAEIIETGKDFTVMIDYAHSPDSLENILTTIKGYAKGRIVCLFGCGGDRDRKKRAIMGRISGEIASFTILTSDNPRTEDPEFIINEIEEGIKETNAEYIKITDRKEAIRYAILNAKRDDVILLAGKGHETYQMFKDKTVTFDEAKIVKDILLNG